MTTQEKQLVDLMIKAVAGPQIAQATQSAEISPYITARFNGEAIMLCCGELEILRLSPSTFKALNEFAVRIGWQCD